MEMINYTNVTGSATIAMIQYHLGGANWSNMEITIILLLVIPLMLFAASANSSVIYAVFSHPPLNTPSNLYLASLAITDLLAAIVIMPVTAYYNIVGVWHFGSVGCQMWMFGTYYLCTTSLYHICAIALDRYRAISHPLTYGSNRSNKKTIMVCSSVWMFVLIIGIPTFLSGHGWKFPETFEEDTPCTIPQDLTLAVYTCFFTTFIPMNVLIVIYVKLNQVNKARMMQKIKKSASKISKIEENIMLSRRNINLQNNKTEGNDNVEDASSDNNEEASNSIWMCPLPSLCIGKNTSATKCLHCQVSFISRVGNINSNLCQICSVPNDLVLAAERSRLAILVQKERKFMFITSVLLGAFVACSVPPTFAFLIVNQYPSFEIPHWVKTIAWWLMYVNSACNPVIYTIFNGDFRDAFIKMFKCVFFQFKCCQ